MSMIIEEQLMCIVEGESYQEVTTTDLAWYFNRDSLNSMEQLHQPRKPLKKQGGVQGDKAREYTLKNDDGVNICLSKWRKKLPGSCCNDKSFTSINFIYFQSCKENRFLLMKRKPNLPLFAFSSKFHITNLKEESKDNREEVVEGKLQRKQHC